MTNPTNKPSKLDRDEEELDEIIYNLVQNSIGNAIKYDNDFGSVLKGRDRLQKQAKQAILSKYISKKEVREAIMIPNKSEFMDGRTYCLFCGRADDDTETAPPCNCYIALETYNQEITKKLGLGE